MVASALPPADELAAAGRLTQARDAKRRSIRRWLDYQDIIDELIRCKKTDQRNLVKLIDAQATCFEQVRLLKGLVKPGSRNVSVRELAPEQARKRVAVTSRARAMDYLAEADAVLRAAQADAPSSTPGAPAQPINPA